MHVFVCTDFVAKVPKVWHMSMHATKMKTTSPRQAPRWDELRRQACHIFEDGASNKFEFDLCKIRYDYTIKAWL